MVSGPRGGVVEGIMGAIPHEPHLLMSPQQPPTKILSVWLVLLGQSMQGRVELTVWPMAWQNALPKLSSAQAIQFSGSPEHLGAEDEEVVAASVIGNIGFTLEVPVLRRMGTGAWKAGKLSSILILAVGVLSCTDWSNDTIDCWSRFSLWRAS